MSPIYSGDGAQEQLNLLSHASLNPDIKRIETVTAILKRVREEGDSALIDMAQQFGDAISDGILVTESQKEAAIQRVSPKTRQLLERAADNIRTFSEAIMQSLQPVHLEKEGFSVGLDWQPVHRLACYVPGGRHPLPSTALMTAITAQAAGVPEIVLISPKLCDETIYAASLAGVQELYRLGGAQGVAAMAYGTESIAAVDMIAGPGNAFVTEAKRQLQGIIGIDTLAGPSEVAIIADEGANPEWVAWDLMAQAEHDPDAHAYLLTNSSQLAKNCIKALEHILMNEPTLAPHLQKTERWHHCFVLPSIEGCIKMVNRLAPEHVELMVSDPEHYKPMLQHYGALFMGYSTPVPMGDYMAGPNHTLPTGRAARFNGALTPLAFLRPQTWINSSAPAKKLLEDCREFALLEGLKAHANSAQCRL